MTTAEPDTITTRINTWAQYAYGDEHVQVITAVTYMFSTIAVLILQAAGYGGRIHSFIAVLAASAGWLVSSLAAGVPVVLLGHDIPRRTRCIALAATLPLLITFALLPALASNHGVWSAAMSAVIGVVYDVVTAATLLVTRPWHLAVEDTT